MLSKIPQEYLKFLSVKDLETLLDLKRRDEELQELMERRDRLARELEAVEERIQAIEDRRMKDLGQRTTAPIVVRKRKTLKEHIVEVMQEVRQPMPAGEIQKRLVDRGVMGRGSNPRSFYNTVFQALQRYDCFHKDDKLYSLKDGTAAEAPAEDSASLKEYVVAVLKHAKTPLKASEIASRALIAGYKTDLDQDGLTQRVTATLKKHLNSLLDWDSQRYRLITPVN